MLRQQLEQVESVEPRSSTRFYCFPGGQDAGTGTEEGAAAQAERLPDAGKGEGA